MEERPKLVRIHSKKKWNDIYSNKLDEMRLKQDEKKKMISNQLTSHTLSTLVAVRLIRRIKNKLKNKGLGIKTIETLKPPELLYRWRVQWEGRQVLCIICDEPCLHEAISCSSCNNIAHYNCIIIEKSNDTGINHSITTKSLYTIKLESYDNEAKDIEYTCKMCFDDYSYTCDKHNLTLSKLKEERLHLHYKEFIAVWVSTRWKIKLHNRQIRANRLLKEVIKSKLIWKKFNKWRRNELRIVIIDIVNISNLTDNHLVTLTVVDPITHTQIFRFDKFGLRCYNESFFLPGVGANMTIIITISIQKRDDNRITNSYEAILQLMFPLKDVINYTLKKDYKLRFNSHIAWLIHSNNKKDIQVIASNNSYVYHTSDSTKSRTTHGVLPPIKQTPTFENALLSPFQSPKGSNFKDNYVCNFYYNPQNSIISHCCIVSAPALDFLKYGFESNGRRHQRMALWWICIYGLKIYFYKKYSDNTPKIIVDIKEFNMSNIRDNKGNIQFIVLQSIDGKKWNFEFRKKEDAIKFENTIIESHRAINNNSNYIKYDTMKSACGFDIKKFGFELN